MAAELSPLVLAERGAVVEVAGACGLGVTSTLFSFLAPVSADSPVAFVDVRQAASPLAALEAGCLLERLAFVTAADADAWARAVGYLIDGVRAVAAEVPAGVPASALRTLAGRARARRRLLALAPVRDSAGSAGLPAGLTTGRLDLLAVEWTGLSQGRGALAERRVRARLTGKLARGGILDATLVLPSLDLEPTVPARRFAGLAAVT